MIRHAALLLMILRMIALKNLKRRLAQSTRGSFSENRRGSAVRRPERRPDYEHSLWATMLTDSQLQNPASRAGILFRRRFRVPYGLFRLIVDVATEKNWMGTNEQNAAKRSAAPLELKVLAWLRTLGRGECFDSCQESTLIHDSTLRDFSMPLAPRSSGKWARHI